MSTGPFRLMSFGVLAWMGRVRAMPKPRISSIVVLNRIFRTWVRISGWRVRTDEGDYTDKGSASVSSDSMNLF